MEKDIFLAKDLFHGISILSLLQIFEEFVLNYSDESFKSSLTEISGGRKELIEQVIEAKQREIFESHGVDPAKGL